jgi:hypothetical protein
MLETVREEQENISMPDQEKDQKQEQQRQPTEAEIYGQQGNQSQYGQGQYGMDGKPDPNGPQAQEIKPDNQKQQSSKTPANNPPQSPNRDQQNKNVPQD